MEGKSLWEDLFPATMEKIALGCHVTVIILLTSVQVVKKTHTGDVAVAQFFDQVKIKNFRKIGPCAKLKIIVHSADK